MLKDYRPESIYKVPKTEVKKAKYPVIDVHCHGARSPQQLDDMVKLMDAAGVEKTVIFTGARTAERFSQVGQLYAQYPKRFDLWCGFDLSSVNEPGFGPKAVQALEACRRLGAMGVGEISDKGRDFASQGGAGRPGGARLVDPVVNAQIASPKPVTPAAPEPTGINFDELLEKKNNDDRE